MSYSAAQLTARPIARLRPSRFHYGLKVFGCLLLACMLAGAQMLLRLHSLEHIEHLDKHPHEHPHELAGSQMLLTLHFLESIEHLNKHPQEHPDEHQCEICLAGASLGTAYLTSGLDLRCSVNSALQPLMAMIRPPPQAICNANRARAPPSAYRY